MEKKLIDIKNNYLEKIGKASSLKELDGIFLAIFGKNGEITLATKEFPKLEKEELKIVAPLLAQIKTELEQAVARKRIDIQEEGYKKLSTEKLDLSEGKVPDKQGHLHLMTIFTQETIDLFAKLGFQQFEAPQIDSDDFNFSLLNIPENHAARDLWDTMYIDSERFGINPGKMLLRTHTSNAQIRIMREFKLPIRMMSIGRCFRYENLDARHEHTFDQFELVYVDKGLSMANLQYLSEYFVQRMVGKDVEVKLRPKYYPFVEPGVGIDGTCIFCKGKGCKVCGGKGYLELGGAGMIHPKVLENAGIDSKVYSGIAWGPGMQRIMMLKYGIEDIRVFLSGNLSKLIPIEEKMTKS